MTEREAIDRIKWKYEKCDGCNRNQIDIDTWNLAILALEKQIPKKPRMWENIDAYCPVCGDDVGYHDALSWEHKAYCNNCGQRIDWSEVEDD